MTQAAKNTATVFATLFETQLEELTEADLQSLKSQLADRANIHQTIYQDGLRRDPPVQLVKNAALSEMYANIAFYSEAVRASRFTKEGPETAAESVS